MTTTEKPKLIKTELWASYKSESGEPYSLYQRTEAMEIYSDGTTKIRFKTRYESEFVRKQIKESLDKAIEDGRAIRDRIGRVKWIKH